MPPILLLLWSKITVDLVKKLGLVKILAPPKNFTKSGLHCISRKVFEKNILYIGHTCYSHNVNIHHGDDLATLNNIGSAEVCQAKCEDNLDCEFFNYETSTKKCWLKEMPGEEHKQVGFISGPKRCKEYLLIRSSLMNVSIW